MKIMIRQGYEDICLEVQTIAEAINLIGEILPFCKKETTISVVTNEEVKEAENEI